MPLLLLHPGEAGSSSPERKGILITVFSDRNPGRESEVCGSCPSCVDSPYTGESPCCLGAQSHRL